MLAVAGLGQGRATSRAMGNVLWMELAGGCRGWQRCPLPKWDGSSWELSSWGSTGSYCSEDWQLGGLREISAWELLSSGTQ